MSYTGHGITRMKGNGYDFSSEMRRKGRYSAKLKVVSRIWKLKSMSFSWHNPTGLDIQDRVFRQCHTIGSTFPSEPVSPFHLERTPPSSMGGSSSVRCKGRVRSRTKAQPFVHPFLNNGSSSPLSHLVICPTLYAIMS